MLKNKIIIITIIGTLLSSSLYANNEADNEDTLKIVEKEDNTLNKKRINKRIHFLKKQKASKKRIKDKK